MIHCLDTLRSSVTSATPLSNDNVSHFTSLRLTDPYTVMLVAENDIPRVAYVLIYYYYIVQGILGPENNQRHLQSVWAYCEIIGDLGVRIGKVG